MSDSFYVVIVEDGLSTDDLNEVIKISKERFECAGNEEFSLNEKEVDKILGNEAFCGGDLSDELMQKLELEAAKKLKFFFSGEAPKDNAEGFKAFLFEVGALKVKIEKYPIEDWNETWKKYYGPIDLGKIVVLPVWDKDIEIKSTQEKIIINPGMGFGTGTHETTKLCLLSLVDELASGKTFSTCLDFGAGAGILGIGFLKFCEGKVDFVDIDESAIENNKDNVRLNFPSSEKEGSFYLRKEFNLNIKYDLVFANILEHVLLAELELLENSVAKEGVLIVSGILNEQKENILNAFEAEFLFIGDKSDGDWLAITFEKR